MTPHITPSLTCVETISNAITNAKDAKAAWIDAALENGNPIPEPNELDKYSGQFKIRMPKSLHRSLAEQSHREGISMNQYCVYLLAQNNAMYENNTTIKTP